MSGLKGSFDCFVGIDVSKDKFDACGITGDEDKLFQFSATMDRKGFDKLKGHLAALSISGGEKMEKEQRTKLRVSNMLYQHEKDYLEFLAEESGRSMSSYLRFLLREAIDNSR